MKVLNVRVIPNAKKNSVSEERGRLRVHVSAPAVGGKANKVMIEVLAEYFKIKKKGKTHIISPKNSLSWALCGQYCGRESSKQTKRQFNANPCKRCAAVLAKRG